MTKKEALQVVLETSLLLEMLSDAPRFRVEDRDMFQSHSEKLRQAYSLLGGDMCVDMTEFGAGEEDGQ